VDITGASTWMLGCTASSSAAVTNSQDVNYWISGLMWLDTCVSSGTSLYDLCSQNAGDVLYTHNCTLSVGTNRGLGSVVAY